MESATLPQGEVLEPAYARFWPRVRALYIDVIVLFIAMVAGLAIAVSLKTDSVARIVGFSVAGFWLLYEPLMVSFAGGTIGHRRTNLRVVDDRTHGNLSLLKALARSVIKGALGWVSFVTMLVTRRSQAVHDLLTRSTVQVRDQSIAGPTLYIRERTELVDAAMPSAGRRVAVILGYALVATVLAFALVVLIVWNGLLSDQCMDYDRCSPRENLVTYALGFGWLAACLAVLVLGWRGRLYGCRAG
jgi:uncharacterized RDD family membrane protein YckC